MTTRRAHHRPGRRVATAGLALSALFAAACEAPSDGPGAAPGAALGPGRALAPAPDDPGHLLPGVSVVTAVHAGPDGWAILDAAAARVVLVGPRGVPEGGVGRPGEGPGELAAPAHAARSGTRVAVLDMAATRLDRFGPNGRAEPRVSIPRGGCAGTMAEGLEPHGDAWIVLQRCADPGVSTTRTLRVDADGSVVELERTPIAGQLTDPFLSPLLVSVPGEGVYLGTTRSACMTRVAGDGRPEHCLRAVAPLPVPAETRARMEERLAGRARSVGLRLQVPDHLPQLLEVRGLDAEARAVRRPVDTRFAPWVVERPGEVGPTLVPEGGHRVEPGPAGVLLLLDELDGVRAWVVPLPGGRP